MLKPSVNYAWIVDGQDEGREAIPASLTLASALSFGTTTAALWITAGLLTVAGSASRPVCGTPAGKRCRPLVMFRAAMHWKNESRARECQRSTAINMIVRLLIHTSVEPLWRAASDRVPIVSCLIMLDNTAMEQVKISPGKCCKRME